MLLGLLGGKCPIYAAIGMPCPCCGMARAYMHVLHGEWSTAFASHPLWWLIPPLWLLICFDDAKTHSGISKFRAGGLITIALTFSARWLCTYVLR